MKTWHSLKRIFHLALAAIAALVGLACARRPDVRPRPRSGDQNVMRVEYVWPSMDTRPLDADTWRSSPWHCGTLTVPSQVVVSGQYACLLETPVVDPPLPGSFFACPTRWRPPSHVC